MFLLEPPPSAFELRFRLFGFPIRVHWMFWIVALLLGRTSPSPKAALIWVSAVFVSIVIHELGHAVAFRAFGLDSRIVLYAMGGLTIPQSNPYATREERLAPWQHVLVSFAGPAAGFLFAGAILAALAVARVRLQVEFELGFIPLVHIARFGATFELYALVATLVFINIMWGIVNLLPIYPLDGGQIARGALEALSVRRAIEISHIASVAAAAAVALVMLVHFDSQWNAFFFGYMAFINYRAIQALRGGAW